MSFSVNSTFLDALGSLNGTTCVVKDEWTVVFTLAKLYFPLMVMNTCQSMILLYTVTHLALNSDIFMWSPLIIIFSVAMMLSPMLLQLPGISFMETWATVALVISACIIALNFLLVFVKCVCKNRGMASFGTIVLFSTLIVCSYPLISVLSIDSQDPVHWTVLNGMNGTIVDLLGSIFNKN